MVALGSSWASATGGNRLFRLLVAFRCASFLLGFVALGSAWLLFVALRSASFGFVALRCAWFGLVALASVGHPLKSSQQIRLPKYSLPIFSENFVDYIPFRESFLCAVDALD